MHFAPPYQRRDLAMVRQAIRNRWNVPESTRAIVARELLRIDGDESERPSLRRSARETLAMMKGAGWIQ